MSTGAIALAGAGAVTNIGSDLASGDVGGAIQGGFTFIMGLLAAHDKRVQEAKAENSACNAAIAAMVQDMQTIAAAVSAGDMTLGAGITACAAVDNWYWQYINPYTQYKNASPARCIPNQFGPNAKVSASLNVIGVGTRCFQSTQPGPVSDDFTAASYIGCNIVDANLGALAAMLNSLQGKASGASGKVRICAFASNKYGLTPFSGLTITVTVPALASEKNVTLSQSGILQVGAPPSSTSATIVQGSTTSGLLSSLGLGNISPTNLLIGLAALVTIIVGATQLRGSR